MTLYSPQPVCCCCCCCYCCCWVIKIIYTITRKTEIQGKVRTAVTSPPHERYTYLTLHDTGAQFQPSGRICPTFKVLRMVDDQPNHEQGDQRHHKNKSVVHGLVRVVRRTSSSKLTSASGATTSKWVRKAKEERRRRRWLRRSLLPSCPPKMSVCSL